MRTTSSLRPSASVGIGERLRDGVEGLGIGIVGTGWGLANDPARRHEAGDVVDVAVGVVVLQAFVDPDDFPGAERLVRVPPRPAPWSSRCGWG